MNNENIDIEHVLERLENDEMKARIAWLEDRLNRIESNDKG